MVPLEPTLGVIKRKILGRWETKGCQTYMSARLQLESRDSASWPEWGTWNRGARKAAGRTKCDQGSNRDGQRGHNFYENVQAVSESLQCLRCSSTVPANPGVCGNCGENVFQ